jgi:hypothetical protein
MNSTILDPNDPDYFIEEYWYGFKQSMINFYNHIKYTTEHIDNWSRELNRLKKEKKYLEIELMIREYMSQYSFDLIQKSYSLYHDRILITNIKRWNRISSRFNFTDDTGESKYSKILLIFMIYLELKKINYINNFFDDIHNMIKYNRYDDLIIYAMENNKHKILELLKSIPTYDFLQDIKRLYPTLIIKKDIKMIKLCIDFKDHKKNSI